MIQTTATENNMHGTLRRVGPLRAGRPAGTPLPEVVSFGRNPGSPPEAQSTGESLRTLCPCGQPLGHPSDFYFSHPRALHQEAGVLLPLLDIKGT